MNIRCEKCGELIWFDKDSKDWLYCEHCKKSTQKPAIRDEEKEKKDD